MQPAGTKLDWHGTVRLSRRAATLALLLAIYLPPHLALRAAGGRSPWARRFLRAATRACGIRVELVGTPLVRDVFFVANHLSWTDILIVGGTVDTAFVAQDMIAQWPVIGTLAQLNDTIFVSRTDRRTAADQVRRLRAALVRPQPVTLFPEGTTTDGHSLLPFKPVLFEGLATAPRPLRVQPVLLDFDAAGSALAWVGNEGAAANARRTLSHAGTLGVRVHFLPPFDPAGLDRKALAAAARARIAAALATTTGHPIP